MPPLTASKPVATTLSLKMKSSVELPSNINVSAFVFPKVSVTSVAAASAALAILNEAPEVPMSVFWACVTIKKCAYFNLSYANFHIMFPDATCAYYLIVFY